MPVIQVQMELPAAELLRAVPDLEQFVQQAVKLLVRRRAPVLPHREAELLRQINQRVLTPDVQARCDTLIAKHQKVLSYRRDAENAEFSSRCPRSFSAYLRKSYL